MENASVSQLLEQRPNSINGHTLPGGRSKFPGWLTGSAGCP